MFVVICGLAVLPETCWTVLAGRWELYYGRRADVEFKLTALIFHMKVLGIPGMQFIVTLKGEKESMIHTSRLFVIT